MLVITRYFFGAAFFAPFLCTFCCFCALSCFFTRSAANAELQAALSSLNETTLFCGAAALTAITDNAALTYLGSLVEGVSDQFKYALVAAAVAGGGLTVIANAPNPAGFAILKNSFDEHSINPFWLFVAALPPTIVAILCFRAIPQSALELFDCHAWVHWFQSLDRTVLFLLILPFMVAVVGLWSDLARSRRVKRASDR